MDMKEANCDLPMHVKSLSFSFWTSRRNIIANGRFFILLDFDNCTFMMFLGNIEWLRDQIPDPKLIVNSNHSYSLHFEKKKHKNWKSLFQWWSNPVYFHYDHTWSYLMIPTSSLFYSCLLRCKQLFFFKRISFKFLKFIFDNNILKWYKNIKIK